ncbi:SpoIIE family protein phosphatase [Micromonospora sp. C72]|uniref:SpoIIE family protein phosphatase n=1 Tax=unclassified Micromonospora TaxID=2617518 RepID=UPI001B3720BC|nr:SpoIIE family protein phosphatase [Micromonospora sp. C72]MBQ1041093.1 SpoIIE family protein phosphatase [Micromonospora sp. C72]
MRAALAGTTGNAVLMGVAEVGTPIGWVLLPGLLGVSARPRVAALVSAWAGSLVVASVLVPVIPGHHSDPQALLASAVSLSAVPLLAWARRRTRTASVTRAGGPPDVAVFTVPAGPGSAALAVCGSLGEIGAAVPLRGGGLLALIGTVSGAALDTPAGRRAIEQTFRRNAQPTASPPHLAGVLDQAVRELAPAGHLRATIVRVDRSGAVEAVRCGSPDLITVSGERADLAGLPAGPALGSTPPAGSTPRAGDAAPSPVTGRRVAVVGAAFADAHGERWVRVLDQVAADDDPAGAARRLTRGPRGGRRIGPALVVDPGPPSRA